MSYFPTLNTGGIITSRYAPLCSHWFICSLIKVLSYLNLNILFKLMCSIHFCGRQYWWKYDCTLSWFLVNWKISVQVMSVLKHAVLLHSIALCCTLLHSALPRLNSTPLQTCTKTLTMRDECRTTRLRSRAWITMETAPSPSRSVSSFKEMGDYISYLLEAGDVPQEWWCHLHIIMF